MHTPNETSQKLPVGLLDFCVFKDNQNQWTKKTAAL